MHTDTETHGDTGVTAPQEAPAAIDIDLGSGRAARDRIGEHATIVLDPENRSVWLFRGIGSGLPERVWNNRCATLSIRADVDLGAAEEALRTHEEDILALFALYRGKHWDGRNTVGRWTRDEEVSEDAYDQILAVLGRALEDLPTYWHASDWFAPAEGDIAQLVADRVRTGAVPEDAIEEVAQAEVDGARSQGEALLEVSEAEDAIRHIYAQRVERLLDKADVYGVAVNGRGASLRVEVDADAAEGAALCAAAALCLDEAALQALCDEEEPS